MYLLNEKHNNQTIFNSLVVATSKMNNINYDVIACSVSGGADSDIVVDLISKLDKDCKVHYVWFDTGLEYEATKEHLKYLEAKYNITIEVEKAEMPIPLACKKYGQPFLSKQVSENIDRLQNHGFMWEDEPFEVLYKKYPNCRAALYWWCNSKGEKSRFNIDYNMYLKEFIMAYPPTFKIGKKCCHYAKKIVSKKYNKRNHVDLSIIGVRKAEGGIRATAYKNCFSLNDDKSDDYRPLFWYKEEDKKQYEEEHNICHSRCYTEYGLKRTGCAGCPYGKDFEFELEVIQKHEPKLYKAVLNIFGESYEYTRKYKEFIKEKQKEKSDELLKSGEAIKRYKQEKLY